MKKLIYIFLLLCITSNSFGQACGGGIFFLNFVSYDEKELKLTECEFFAVKSEVLPDGINSLLDRTLNHNDLNYGVPIDSILFENIADKNKNALNTFPNLKCNFSSENNYGISIHFYTVELSSSILTLKIKIDNKDYFLLGDFTGGCSREQTFNIDDLTLKPMRNNFIGRVDDLMLYYNCFECTSSTSNGIKIYVQNIPNIKTRNRKYDFRIELLKLSTYNNYLDKVKIIKIKKHKFIYVQSNQPNGHSNCEVFSIDKNNLRLDKVKFNESDYRIPDSLSIREVIGLSFKDNIFTTRAFLRSETTGIDYSITTFYVLKKIRKNQYELKSTETVLYESN